MPLTVSSTSDYPNVALPDFLRVAWVSDRAREVWMPRLKRVVAAWGLMERESVLCGIRKCALERRSTDVQPTEVTVIRGAISLKLESPQISGSLSLDTSRRDVTSSDSSSHFVVGDARYVGELRSAWLTQDHDAIGQLLGYPSCCIRAYCERYAESDSKEPIWAIANADEKTGEPLKRHVEVGLGESACNVLWRALGIRAVPHLPCRFDCDASVDVSGRFFGLANGLGLTAEWDWLIQILTWPVEWSALHGVAEVKTPILKFTTITDATASKVAVSWLGTAYPVEGARAVRFPYQTPERLQVTESPAHQRGLATHSGLVQVRLGDDHSPHSQKDETTQVSFAEAQPTIAPAIDLSGPPQPKLS
jgi:hypothetical protein